MEYTSKSTKYKLKKVLRYIKLYGIRRTFIKVRGQYHMKKKFNKLPKFNTNLTSKQHIGIIGCGNFAFCNIAYYLNNKYGKIIAGCMDIDINKAASLARFYKVPVFSDKLEDLLNLENLKIVYIASNHASHAEYAIKCLEKGLDVYIEKPHVVNEDQLFRLVNAGKKCKNRIYLGFNRPESKFGQIIKKYLNKESGPGIYNWFVSGHHIDPDHWYYHPEEGGRVLGNLCHWTDFLLRLIPETQAYPIEIVPVSYISNDTDIAVTFKFNEGTISVITFSAKGDNFEGVREKFNAHKGECQLSLSDFQRLTVDVLDKKKTYKLIHRDQGHQNSLIRPFDKDNWKDDSKYLKNLTYVWNTGWLFLKTQEALNSNKKITVHPFEEEYKQYKITNNSVGMKK